MAQDYIIMRFCLSAPCKTLAAQIIVYRLLGLNKETSIACMQELMRRRALGSDFNYEFYIENELKNSPPTSNNNLQTLFKLDLKNL